MTTRKILDIAAHAQKVGDPLTGARRKPGRVGRLRMRPIVAGTLIALLLAAVTMLFGPGAHASASVMAEHESDGYVYVLNNNLVGSNSISVYSREEDGSLTFASTTSIGGTGSVLAFADGTQGSLIITHDEGTRLFAVDAGSNQISVVNVHKGHLAPVGVFSSHGVGPVSLSYHDGLLYVLNAANGSTQAANVAGFRVDDEGNLHYIAGSTQPLSVARPDPGQIQVDPSGHYLLVTEKLTNLIDVYRIDEDGSLSVSTPIPSVGAVPFGIAFNPTSRHQLVVTDATGGPNHTGGATSYRLAGGAINLINGPVFDFQLAPCWVVITNDGRFAYTSNADSLTISGYSIAANGAITLLTPNGATATAPAGTFPIEEGLSRDSHFLYVLDSRLLLTPPGPATLLGYHINHGGSLTPVIDPANFVLPLSAIGLAAE